MNIYKHSGVYGLCIVIAETKKDAEKIIRQRLDDAGLEDEKFNIRKLVIPCGGTIHFNKRGF